MDTNFVNQNIEKFVDRVTAKEIPILDELFADMFYYTGVPFCFADHPAVKRFHYRLRPNYKPPRAKQLAGT